VHCSKGKWYFGLLAATLILSVATLGESGRASSKAYAEEQIYKTQMLHKPILLISISVVEEQVTQELTENETEMQQ
jgi:hypothetical protein